MGYKLFKGPKGLKVLIVTRITADFGTLIKIVFVTTYTPTHLEWGMLCCRNFFLHGSVAFLTGESS